MGRGPRPRGTGQSPALGELTTTAAQPVVIVDYNKASLVVLRRLIFCGRAIASLAELVSTGFADIRSDLYAPDRDAIGR